MLKHFHLTRRQWKAVLKWTIYSLLFLFVLIVQDVILSQYPIFGIKISWVPLFIVCVCIREGPESGGLFALLTALIWCLSGADYGNISVAVIPIGSILAAVLCRSVLTVRFFPTFLGGLAVSLINETLIFIFKVVLASVHMSNYLRVLLPGVALSLVLLPPLYFTVKAVSRIGGSDDV